MKASAHIFTGPNWHKVAKDPKNDPLGSVPSGKIKHAVLIIDGKRYRGPSHFQAVMKWNQDHPREQRMPHAKHEGFETESDHFLDRSQAAEYALHHNNQFRGEAERREAADKEYLISEDLHLRAIEGQLYTQDAVMAATSATDSDDVKKKNHNPTWITLRS